MKKIITIIISIILLMASTVYAETAISFRDEHYNKLIILCEDGYRDKSTSELYECILNEFYGLNKVIDYLVETERDTEDWNVLMELFYEHSWWDSYETYDFMAIHLDFEEYLEGKIEQ